MEAETAVRIWQRNVDYKTPPVQFTIFLSDEDSKAPNAACNFNMYADTEVEKEECLNHVAKQLGTGLRKLLKPLPRSEKLREPTIQSLHTYFQLAIVNRGTVHNMYTRHMGPVFPLLLNRRCQQPQVLSCSTRLVV